MSTDSDEKNETAPSAASGSGSTERLSASLWPHQLVVAHLINPPASRLLQQSLEEQVQDSPVDREQFKHAVDRVKEADDAGLREMAQAADDFRDFVRKAEEL